MVNALVSIWYNDDMKENSLLTQFTLRIGSDLKDELDTLARAFNVSTTALINIVLREFIELKKRDNEDYFDLFRGKK